MAFFIVFIGIFSSMLKHLQFCSVHTFVDLYCYTNKIKIFFEHASLLVLQPKLFSLLSKIVMVFYHTINSYAHDTCMAFFTSFFVLLSIVFCFFGFKFLTSNFCIEVCQQPLQWYMRVWRKILYYLSLIYSRVTCWKHEKK